MPITIQFANLKELKDFLGGRDTGSIKTTTKSTGGKRGRKPGAATPSKTKKSKTTKAKAATGTAKPAKKRGRPAKKTAVAAVKKTVKKTVKKAVKATAPKAGTAKKTAAKKAVAKKAVAKKSAVKKPAAKKAVAKKAVAKKSAVKKPAAKKAVAKKSAVKKPAAKKPAAKKAVAKKSAVKKPAAKKAVAKKPAAKKANPLKAVKAPKGKSSQAKASGSLTIKIKGVIERFIKDKKAFTANDVYDDLSKIEKDINKQSVITSVLKQMKTNFATVKVAEKAGSGPRPVKVYQPA
ncbi:MAG: hypothetical protein K2X01_09110 [Cyanobacteria bacterium]|nr:hypothetical protein [Cyanobacteriota bacterium]